MAKNNFVQKKIALVAHDGMKDELLKWVEKNRDKLSKHKLCGTGTTGKIIQEQTGLLVERFLSGPIGGDQQIGSKIAEGEIHILIFFWDPLEPQPHDPDVKALLRLAVLHNIPTASNLATADFLIDSDFFENDYQTIRPDYQSILKEIHADGLN